MLNWDDMRYLLAVARSGSMSGAARQLEVNHATVIRRIRSLEEQLGTSLFDRMGHSYVITPAGQVTFDAAEKMEAQSISVEREVLGQVTDLRGCIRVTAPEPLGGYFLLPAISIFMERYPDIMVDVSLSMRAYDLGLREADVAIRVTDQPPADLVGTKIATMMMAAYAPSGSGMRAQDIERVVAMSTLDDGLPDWAARYCPTATVGLITDSPTLELDAIKAGFGVGRLPCAMGDKDPDVERIDDIPLGVGSQLWMLTHVDVRTNARIRVFRDYMLDYMFENEDMMKSLNGA